MGESNRLSKASAYQAVTPDKRRRFAFLPGMLRLSFPKDIALSLPGRRKPSNLAISYCLIDFLCCNCPDARNAGKLLFISIKDS